MREGEEQVLMASAFQDICEEFLKSFKGNSDNYKYLDAILKLRHNDSRVLLIDYRDLEYAAHINGDRRILDMMENSFDECYRGMRFAVLEILERIQPDYFEEVMGDFRIAFNNLDIQLSISKINDSHIGKLREITGMVLQRTDPQPFYVEAAYKCTNCESVSWSPSVGFSHKELKKCPQCSEPLVRDEANSKKDTYQRFIIQERLDRLEIDTIRDIQVVLVGKELMDRVRVGEYITLSGVVKVLQLKNQGNSTGRFYVEALWIEAKTDEYVVDDIVMQKDVELAIDPNDEDRSLDRLVDAICPSLRLAKQFKLAILLMLVGADKKTLSDGRQMKGENVYLEIGDPSAGKTTLAEFTARCFKRPIISKTNMSTEVGLKGSVVEDEDGIAAFKAGAFLLGDFVYVDGLGNMKKETVDSLEEAIDTNQTITVHKRDIHKQFKINVAAIFSMNPVINGGRWDPSVSLAENSGLPGWFLARLDLIMVFRDLPSLDEDEEKWNQQIGYIGGADTSGKAQRLTKEDYKSIAFFRAFSAYARKTFHPRLLPGTEAEAHLKKSFLNLRKMGWTWRGLPSLIKLAEESARAHYRNDVLLKDAELAVNLVVETMATSGFIPGVGEIANKMVVDPAEKHEDINKFFTKEVPQARPFLKNAEKFRKAVESIASRKCLDCKDGITKEDDMAVQCDTCKGTGRVWIEFDLKQLAIKCQGLGIPQTFIHAKVSAYYKNGWFMHSGGDIYTVQDSQWDLMM